ncbi:AsnC family transcriptional regulator [Pokkaliibacter plantistimulans]|uniref:AsnC family transcriptional regulator n=2 Tax=Pseudomonadota TaxID=1224 RepID=A0ABX5LWZ4_9GAMM|nr:MULTISPECIES: Lrp/AsnC family transcriptional regulator [Pokkaliibacter]MDH2432709.1 Lrp/AsnC family transcriptional regulator [Pokkaliibacter sp. MBI-7]PPC74287.1 AsnC family transcriptional regulator [Pokkaliibacter plantistimulans]PXF31134.1 AsnC family transcriptional regulator [Pokkaliibacter plantistimulans]
MSMGTKLDKIDINILTQLQKNGRMTNVSLADAVGLSASPCLQRVKRLESAGYITSYKAFLNLSKITEFVTVFTEVSLTGHKREDFVKFEANIRQIDEVMECHLISGGYDYLVRFLTRNIQHYQEVIEDIVDRNIGVAKYFSYIVIKSPVIKEDMPLKKLLRS